MKKKTIITIVCILGAVVLLGLLASRRKHKEVVLETDRIEAIDIRNAVTATGKVEPVKVVNVGTQVSGIINKLYVDFNDEVKAGQVIAEMDKVNLQAELTSATAQLSSAKTEFQYREKEYDRIKTLHEKELVSDSDYDSALYQYERAKNAYDQANSAIVKVRRNLAYATITSPINGVVINRAVEEGQTVAAGFSTPTLFTIANDLTKMQVIAEVDEADIGQVMDGQHVDFTVDAYPDDVFAGTVQQVRLEAKTTSSVVTYQVVISAENPDLKLKPGLTANVTISTSEKKGVLSVPTKALRFVPDAKALEKMNLQVEGEAPSGKHIWLKEGNNLKAVAVKTGFVSGNRTEVSGDLQVGQEVACDLTTKEE